MVQIVPASFVARSARIEGAIGREHHSRGGLQAGQEVLGAVRLRDRCPCIARDRGNQRAGSSGRYCQGAGVAWPCQHCDNANP